MCAIIGAIVKSIDTPERLQRVNDILNHITKKSHERGRDGRGFMVNSSNEPFPSTKREIIRVEMEDEKPDRTFLDHMCLTAVVIGNLRAEPTTEYVSNKKEFDQQPYSLSSWAIVHNGTIANDKQLRDFTYPTKIDSAAFLEHLENSELKVRLSSTVFQEFHECVQDLKGSFAILANYITESHHLMAAVNYRPIWYAETDVGIFLASSRHYFPKDLVPVMLEPYSVASFRYDDFIGLRVNTISLRKEIKKKRALVVCSGGLDSVVAATYVKRVLGYDITLLHFRYGSRAEGPEVSAIWKIAESLGVGVRIHYIDTYSPDDSPLLRPDSEIAGGEAGAEFAHEWVPARNLVMLAIATATAEANGFDTIVLGNNLEEAGAYPDNEPEFISKFNDLLPFAVGDGKQIEVIMPVGNLMKHEIVKLGDEINAPMDKTWSCYRAGELHCGTCGPCFMRRKAFEINGIPEVINYLDNGAS